MTLGTVHWPNTRPDSGRCEVTRWVSLDVHGVGRTVSGDVNDYWIRLGCV
jgi:hypothetical protein